MQRKSVFYQRFCQLSHLGSVIIDFSTEHNLTSIYRYYFFISLSIWWSAASGQINAKGMYYRNNLVLQHFQKRAF